jgi:phospholipid transport system transporter-binding protein
MSALRIERIDPARARVSGRLGFHEAAAAADRWRELGAAGGAEIVADVGALEGVDSATLAVLLAWAAQLQRVGTRLRVAGAPPDLAALAALCGTRSLLGIAA